MKKQAIASKLNRRFNYRTRDNDARYLGTKNLLLGRGDVRRANEVWAGDVTYIRVNGRWTYLAVVMDVCTRRIIGWAYSRSRTSDLVCEALAMAVRTSKPSINTIFHSDQGIEYASREFRQALADSHLTQSMSRRGR